jgi:hypothetical protein
LCNAKSVFIADHASLGWLNNVISLILSALLIKGRIYFNILNEELLAACDLLVRSGANVKPTQVCSAPAGRQVISTTLAAPQREL